MSIPLLSTFKLGGFTSASDIDSTTAVTGKIATVTVERYGDGTWRFTVSGKRYTYSGNNADVNALLEALLTGTGGLASSDRLFGNTGVA